VKTSDFDYDLPEAAIAQVPAEPRDAARLLDADRLTDHTVAELPDLLEPGDLLVVNRTRVRPARLVGVKEPTGGAVEALLLAPLGDDRWEALVRPSRRLRPGSVLRFGSLIAEIVAGPERGGAVLRLDFGGRDVEAVLDEVGEVPLPPYIHRALDDPERYQTVFAQRPGSAAAPTAGLHLTERVLERLPDRGIGLASVELHIGVDTFRPIQTEEVADHEMHSEWASVGEEAVAAVAATRRAGGRVVAVGTTVVRSLETAAAGGAPEPFEGSTDLFITPGFRFRVVDLLVTNFHVPGSTLVVLVAAFCGERWRSVYATALERGYRFLSFGDAMLVRGGAS
jgi:S-adenosylmethionine:tRNA ribosyltransferase-isomerase